MNFFKVPDEEMAKVREAIVKRGMDPKQFEMQASTDLLGSGPVKTVITMTRGGTSRKFERVLDDKWVAEACRAVEDGAFD